MSPYLEASWMQAKLGLAILAALAALCALSGCQTLGVGEKPLGSDEYARLRASPDFAPAWANPSARDWMLDALDSVNRLQGQRDAPAPANP